MKKMLVPRIEVVFDFRKKATDENPGTVHVRVNNGRNERKYISTNVRVLPCQWDEKYWVVKHRDAKKLNKMIQEQVDACKHALGGIVEMAAAMPLAVSGHKVVKITSADAKRMKVDRSEASFLDWMNDQIENDMELREGTKRHHRTVYRSLEQYGKIRKWCDVTADNIEGWLRWLRREYNSEMEQVTVYGYLKRLKKWVHVAQEKKLLPMDCLVGIRCSRGESKDREFLTDEEFEAWCACKLPNKHLRNARDRFIVQAATGMAVGDFESVDFGKSKKMGGNWTLAGRRQKTGEQFFLVILPFAIDILERWEWKIPSISRQKYNDYLGVVAEYAGIDKHITSHVARHTYATYCLRHGVRIEAVQRTLGHSSIKTTQIYAKLEDKAVVDAFARMA